MDEYDTANGCLSLAVLHWNCDIGRDDEGQMLPDDTTACKAYNRLREKLVRRKDPFPRPAVEPVWMLDWALVSRDFESSPRETVLVMAPEPTITQHDMIVQSESLINQELRAFLTSDPRFIHLRFGCPDNERLAEGGNRALEFLFFRSRIDPTFEPDINRLHKDPEQSRRYPLGYLGLPKRFMARVFHGPGRPRHCYVQLRDCIPGERPGGWQKSDEPYMCEEVRVMVWANHDASVQFKDPSQRSLARSPHHRYSSDAWDEGLVKPLELKMTTLTDRLMLLMQGPDHCPPRDVDEYLRNYKPQKLYRCTIS